MLEIERQKVISTLDARCVAVNKWIQSNHFKNAKQIEAGAGASSSEIKKILELLTAKNLIESRPGPLGLEYRPTPDRPAVVGDWITGKALARGYDSLAEIQRDYPMVEALSDFADGVEAAKKALDKKREQEAAAEANRLREQELKAENEAKKLKDAESTAGANERSTVE